MSNWRPFLFIELPAILAFFYFWRVRGLGIYALIVWGAFTLKYTLER